MLEHLDYCLKLHGRKSPYGYAAYRIFNMREPIGEIRDLTTIKGVGPVTEKLIREIIRTGRSQYLESLI